MIAQAEYEIDLRYPIGHVCRATKKPKIIEIGKSPILLKGYCHNANTLSQITEFVNKNLGVKLDEILSTSRFRRIVEARLVISYVAKLKGYSWDEIAKFMHKDRTSIYHYYGLAENIFFARQDQTNHLVQLIRKLL